MVSSTSATPIIISMSFPACLVASIKPSYDGENQPGQSGSPATLKDVRERFEAFLKDRCKGKEDPEKLRFIIE